MNRIFILLFIVGLVSQTFSQNPCANIQTVNYSGKIYNTVQIGTQCWLKENLDVGTMISGNKMPANNLTIEKYYYNNDSVNKNYGAFYLWNEAMQYKNSPANRGICPEGWHIPTKSEFDKLCDYVQNNSNALKVSGIGTGLGVGTNASGFSSLLSGYKGNDGYFAFQNSYVRYWTSTSVDTNNANTILLYFNNGNIGRGTGDKEFGYSVRCINDKTTNISEHNGLQTEISLSQNYPNPFNPTTKINFYMPHFSHVTLTIYDLLGNEVRTLINSEIASGYHEVDFNASNLSSGIYFYKIRADKFIDIKKMLLIK